MSYINIAVLFGGNSSEYGVSLQSASSVMENLSQEKYQVYPIGITPEGEWFYFKGDVEAIKKDHWMSDWENLSHVSVTFGKNGGIWEESSTEGKKRLNLDMVFPVLHGRFGEDGCVQGMLELTGLPVVGCGVLASALCMDKDRAHKLVSLDGVRVPKSVLIYKGENQSENIKKLGLPVFVKPLKAGSSYGITKVTAESDMEHAIQEAFLYDDQVLIEENINGFEVGCAVTGNRVLSCGRVDEIELSNGFFDFKEKYTLETSQIHMPARISKAMEMTIQETAKKIYQCLGCTGLARVDLFLTPEQELVFNEVNTIPGFTSHSRFPNMMKGVGLEFDQLLDQIISKDIKCKD